MEYSSVSTSLEYIVCYFCDQVATTSPADWCSTWKEELMLKVLEVAICDHRRPVMDRKEVTLSRVLASDSGSSCTVAMLWC